MLRREFAHCERVLEIGSGTGQHAVTFGAELGHVVWQTSDLEDNHPGIHAWLGEAGLDNVQPPMSLDVHTAEVPDAAYDAVFSANTAHIMSWEGVAAMFRLVGKALRPGGVFCLYGPFRQDGRFNTQSNADFHTDLRGRDAAMGIRHLEALDELGTQNGLARSSLYALPSNNMIAVWHKQGAIQ